MGVVGYIGFAILFVLIGLVFWEAISLRRQVFADVAALEKKSPAARTPMVRTKKSKSCSRSSNSRTQ